MKTIISVCVLSCGLIFNTHSQAAKLYKWVDENGVVSYQDTPPPKGSKILEESTTVSAAIASAKQDDSNRDPVKIYTLPNCDLCDTVARHLKTLDVPLIELPLQNDREAQSTILERSNSLTTPTIFVGQQMFQGGDIAALEEVLESNGYKLSKPEPANSQNSDDEEQTDDQEQAENEEQYETEG